jgi:DNA polymerase V
MSKDDGVSIHSGFPNPASDRNLEAVDLHRLLVKQPTSTFFMRIEGNDWEERAIFDGDIAVIDRSLNPRKNDLAVASKDDGFMITTFAKLPEDCTFWGTVTAVIHQYRS